MIMDYQFRRDVSGRVDAQFSMGHETMGTWLMAEIGSDVEAIEQVLGVVAHVEGRMCLEFAAQGEEFSFVMTADEVEVGSKRIVTEEAVSHDANEAISQCGLDDFKTMMLEWRQFVQGH